MKTELIITNDGSHTLYLPEIDEHYHSTHGAIQESQHIFIEAGLRYCSKKEITIFEVGFGTGLNAYLTCKEATSRNLKIHYITIEKYPIDKQVWQSLNYPFQKNENDESIFYRLHEAPFNEETQIIDGFTIRKIQEDFTQLDFNLLPPLDLIYFDAFSPEKQPEMWSDAIFLSLFNQSNPSAILVTYCAKGLVRRTMQSAGFLVERLPGPPGKREMLRAIRQDIKQ